MLMTKTLIINVNRGKIAETTNIQAEHTARQRPTRTFSEIIY